MLTSTQRSPGPGGGSLICSTGVGVAVGVLVGVEVNVGVDVGVGVAVGVDVGVGVGSAVQTKPVPKQPVTAMSATVTAESNARLNPTMGVRRDRPFSPLSTGGSRGFASELSITTCSARPRTSASEEGSSDRSVEAFGGQINELQQLSARRAERHASESDPYLLQSYESA